jgi:hypothetical protein
MRAALANSSELSDVAFQTIVEGAVHPKLAQQVSIDGGIAHSSNEAWRVQFLGKAQLFDAEHRGPRAQPAAVAGGNINNNNNNFNKKGFKRNGIRKKKNNKDHST